MKPSSLAEVNAVDEAILNCKSTGQDRACHRFLGITKITDFADQKTFYLWFSCIPKIQTLNGMQQAIYTARGILCENLQENCRTHILRAAFCASLRSRNTHGHVLCGNLEEKCLTPRHFARGVETHMDISRAMLCGNLEEKCRTSREHLDWTPGLLLLYSYRKNPFTVASGYTVWGKTTLTSISLGIDRREFIQH